MKIEASLASRVSVDVDVLVEPTLMVKWDEKLTASESNPFPLAPIDLVAAGLVTRADYARQNKIWRNAVELFLGSEAEQCSVPEVRNWNWEIYGAGLGREAQAVRKIARYHFSIIIRDNSKVACNKAKKFSLSHKLNWRIEHMEIRKAWKQGKVDVATTIALEVSQVVQISDEATMAEFMKLFAQFVLEPLPVGYPQRRVYLVHATHRANKNPVEWAGHWFPFPQWGDTTPYEVEELLAATGCSGEVVLEEIGSFRYFHQHYSVLKLMAL